MINPLGPHQSQRHHGPRTSGGVTGQEQPWAVPFPLPITKSPTKTHRGDQTPPSGGGCEPPDQHQPGGGNSPDSPMMAWTRTESCVRRMRVGRLPFLG